MPRPTVVIVGRPNVGKSSLLNMLSNRRVAIVDPTAGVTRDRVTADAELPPIGHDDAPLPVRVIDTGGYGISDIEAGDQHMPRDMTADVERQIARGLAEADAVLLVIDAQAGVVTLDERVASVVRKSAGDTPVIVVANKVDDTKQEPGGYEAASLGFGDPVLVSAVTKHNLHELNAALREALRSFDAEGAKPQAAEGEEAPLLVAVVGKRNAGKSTLVNALAGDERVIVSEQPGTTRDSVDVRVTLETTEGPRELILIDTAGVRRRKSLANDIEYYATHRALRSVRRADVVLLLIDAAVPTSQVDRQLVQEILKHHRPTVIVINKWDLAEKRYTQEQYAEYLDDALKGLSFAPIVFTSAKHNEGLRDALAMALNLREQATHRVGTGELNQVIERITAERGPAGKGGKWPKVYYVSQVATDPPTIVLKVNIPDLFDHNYQRYLLNRLRDELPYSEVPIQLLIRGKEREERK